MMVLFSATVTFLPLSVSFGGVKSGATVKDGSALLKASEKDVQKDVQKVEPLSGKEPAVQISDGSATPKRPALKSQLPKTTSMNMRSNQKKTTVAQVQNNKKSPTTSKAATRKPTTIQKTRLPLTLDQAINLALEHNLGLQIQAFNRDAAQTVISQQQAAFHPTVIGTADVTSTDAAPDDPSDPLTTTRTQRGAVSLVQPLPTGTGATLALTGDLERTSPSTSGDSYVGGLGLTFQQPLLRGGRMFVATQGIANAEYGLKIEEATLRQTALEVILATKTFYYNMLNAEKQIEVTKQAIERDKILKDTSVGLFEGGLTTLRDVYSVDIDLAGDMASLAGDQADKEAQENFLLDVLGIPIATTDVELLDKDVGFEPIPLDLDTWLQVALENRPEIMRIQQQIAMQDLEVRKRENDILPQLDFVGGYRRVSPSAPSSGSAFRFELEDWSAGLVFSVPLGNVQRKSSLSQSKIQRMALERQLINQQRAIRVEVLNTVITLRQSLAEMKALEERIKHSKGKLETARARFALGVANNLDISDAQIDLRESQSQLLSAIITYNIGIATLEARIASSIQIKRS